MSTTDGMVETQLCKLRDTSDTLIGALLFYTPFAIQGVRESTLVYLYDTVVDTQFRKFLWQAVCAYHFENCRTRYVCCSHCTVLSTRRNRAPTAVSALILHPREICTSSVCLT